MVESMLWVLVTILEWLLTLKLSRNRENQLVCVAFFLQFKLLLPHIDHRANCNHHQIFLGQGLLIGSMIQDLEESIPGLETGYEVHWKTFWMFFSRISTSTDVYTENYPEEDILPTLSPWRHQSCLRVDHPGVFQRSSIQTRQFM